MHPMKKPARPLTAWILFSTIGAFLSAATADEVAPAPKVHVEGEQARLSPDAPHAWARGTRLRQIQTLGPGHGTPAQGAVDINSIVVRHDGRVLEAGKDYVVHPVSGSLGIGPDPSAKPNVPITIDYTYRLRRLDSKIRTADGETEIRAGTPDLSVPQPPSLKPGDVRLANLFIDYGCDGTNADIYPVQESPQQAVTGTTAGKIPERWPRLPQASRSRSFAGATA
jgi:hypothetical protein